MEDRTAGETEFIDSAHALVQALDAWASCLGGVLQDRLPSRQAVLARLRDVKPRIDGSLLTQWLKGRNMLLEKGARGGRVPEVQDAHHLASVFLLEEEETDWFPRVRDVLSPHTTAPPLTDRSPPHPR
ncbi:hypothetical protein ACWGB8_12905 [Kitasatospora sp. NPDC054939]